MTRRRSAGDAWLSPPDWWFVTARIGSIDLSANARGLTGLVELLQLLRGQVPRRFRFPENAALGSRTGIPVQQAGWYQHVFGGDDLMRHARPALRAERYGKAFGALKIESL